MNMKTALGMAADILGDIEDGIEDDADMTQEEFDAAIDEIFKDVPNSLEGDDEEVGDPEWDDGTTEEQKEEERRELRAWRKQFSREVDEWFDQMVADGTILESLG